MLITVPKSNPVAVNGPLHTFMVLKHTQTLRRKNPTLVSESGLIPWRAQLFQLLAYCWQHDPPIQQCSRQTFYLEEEKIKLCFHSNLFYQMNSSIQNVTCQ